MLSKYNFIEQYAKEEYVELFLSSYKILNRLIEEDIIPNVYHKENKQLTDILFAIFTPRPTRNIPIKLEKIEAKKRQYNIGIALTSGSSVGEAINIGIMSGLYTTNKLKDIDCISGSSAGSLVLGNLAYTKEDLSSLLMEYIPPEKLEISDFYYSGSLIDNAGNTVKVKDIFSDYLDNLFDLNLDTNKTISNAICKNVLKNLVKLRKDFPLPIFNISCMDKNNNVASLDCDDEGCSFSNSDNKYKNFLSCSEAIGLSANLPGGLFKLLNIETLNTTFDINGEKLDLVDGGLYDHNALRSLLKRRVKKIITSFSCREDKPLGLLQLFGKARYPYDHGCVLDINEYESTLEGIKKNICFTKRYTKPYDVEITWITLNIDEWKRKLKPHVSSLIDSLDSFPAEDCMIKRINVDIKTAKAYAHYMLYVFNEVIRL